MTDFEVAADAYFLIGCCLWFGGRMKQVYAGCVLFVRHILHVVCLIMILFIKLKAKIIDHHPLTCVLKVVLE